MPNSSLATPTATQAVLAAHGLWTKKRLGQHFLVDDNIVGRTLGLAGLTGSEIVLEVGPGIGTLTVALCREASAVVAVEADRDLIPVLEETTSGCGRLSVIQADATSVSVQAVSSPFGAPVALVANLPYAVAATVVLRFFQEMPLLRFAVVMVQAEVADRMAASPGSRDYGSYTVKLQLLAEPAGRFAVARTCFMPAPRVDSAIIRLERRSQQLEPPLLEDAFFAADAAFAQRRKTLRNSLRGSLGGATDALDAALAEADLDGSLRAETLPPECFVRLGAALRGNALIPERDAAAR